MTDWLHDDDECVVCRRGRARARRRPFRRRFAWLAPYLIVSGVIVAIAVANGVLGGGPR